MPLPAREGLYDPAFEHDACGLGFVATLDRAASHTIVSRALEILGNLTHRGAAGSDPSTGDGAGVLLQIPHALFAAERPPAELPLPEPGGYGVAMCFLAQEPARRRRQEAILEAAVLRHGQRAIGWRDVPLDPSALGPVARATMPAVRQLFIGKNEARIPRADHEASSRDPFERTLFMIRKRAGRTASVELGGDDFYVASCSSKTVVYKGLMLAEQLASFYPDLGDERTASRLAMVHSRFSTNTFPTWERAHPFRLIAHNGEINTLRGNSAWMHAREALLASPLFGDAIEDFTPIIRPAGSDSASLDNVVDFLVAGGRSLPHVMMMLIPEAFAEDPDMSPEKRAFYEYQACLVEPWEGPAAIVFSDGDLIGATLDGNGLRPAKWVATSDGLVVLASELGVLGLDPATVVQKGRVQPGKLFLVDTREGRIVSDAEIKHRVATGRPYRAWLDENKIELRDLPDVDSPYRLGAEETSRLQQVFGYTEEELRMVLSPMAAGGEEPVGSMGADVPLAVLSARPQLLFGYFKQQFAQVTNPPIDPIREAIVMSEICSVGGEKNLLEETPAQCRMLQLPHPILTAGDVAKLRRNAPGDFRARTLPMRFRRPAEGTPSGEALSDALEELALGGERAVDEGASILILSDRDVGPEWVPIPSLLATAALHNRLIAGGRRVRAGIVVESAEPREVAHVALLVGYGASAVNPYLALETAAVLAREDSLPRAVGEEKAEANLVRALRKGLVKTMSKMGCSSVSSYQGAQLFEAVGIDQVVIDRAFTGTSSRIRGIGWSEIADEALARHARAYGPDPSTMLDAGGRIHFRLAGERHLWRPETIAALQRAVRTGDAASYATYSRLINEQSEPVTLRSLWDLAPAGKPLPLEDVEPAASIVKRFVTGAMSFGSISKEAHETLAIAMNRIGGRSNTGEGGEDPERFADERRSAIKQVASGRFGVTTHYLVNADELQIKMAQGAKPGEGGQIPGHKVDAIIARVRHSTPGVTLISPPPHHDIYSIEDLAQLVFDLGNVNPTARISVKLVSVAGVGTIAAGVAKTGADAILVSGHDGGTGASPLTAIHHAGTPWELGLAETQQVLVMNGLRGRVRLQVDGQIKTGRDVVIGALLGAEEFGFATAPLVATGCIMLRKCHLNTCPMGVATQDPVLRERFRGEPEHVIRFMFFVAEEVRSLMGGLGFRTFDEMVGRVDCIAPRPANGLPKVRRLDFSEVLHRPRGAPGPVRCVEKQDHELGEVTDRVLLAEARGALEGAGPVRIATPIRNRDRAFGAMLSGEIVRRLGAQGLEDDTITVVAVGSAGQSFGAFGARGLTLVLEGDANDYVGKGLSGAILAVRPHRAATFRPEEQVIVGNTVLYGATSGRAFFSGRAGERFCVRNSGATAVVEGIGDHGCEYMTGGEVVVLGTTGRNFAAGMTGGLAWVFDEDGAFVRRCNREMVELEALEGLDGERLRALVSEHHARTASPRASELLASWPRALGSFVKVVPSESRRALADRTLPETAGIRDRQSSLPPRPYVSSGPFRRDEVEEGPPDG
ncbi:MAG: glutamate synthase large subunit [Deltaproteobacteria bacterium]|nr:glutamate synthase large subunit [Deltaproteobacteria bacterium]